MDLKDYINKTGGDEPPVIHRKRREKEVVEKVPEKEKVIVPEMTDDECLQFYVDLSNMAYMAINDKLRPLEIEEVQPVKTAAGNVIRTAMKLLGDYRFYLDVAIVAGFTIGIYKQRAAELPQKEDKGKVVELVKKEV